MAMAVNVAQWQYEEEDTVAILPKYGGIKIGLVKETRDEDASSDDDESSNDDYPKLKPGQLRVEWYPTGKEAAVFAGTTYLLDRSLLMGEIVCRRSQPNRVGSVRNVSIRADFLLLPECQFVIRDVSHERIDFVNKFDDASSSCYVGYENWAGALVASSDKLLLESEEGYQCWLSTSECGVDNLSDCCTKRLEDSSYNTRQWYEGEPVKVTLKSLTNAQWLPNHKPPESFLRKLKTSSRSMKCTVLKVEPEMITVRWISATSGPNARLQPPPSKLNGQDLEKVRKLDHFEYQSTQIGDRIWITIGPNDVVTPYAAWRDELRRQLKAPHLMLRTDNSGAVESAKSSDNPAVQSSSIDTAERMSEDTVVDGATSLNSVSIATQSEGSKSGQNLLAVTVTDWMAELSQSPLRSRHRLGVVAHRRKRYVASSAGSPSRPKAVANPPKKRKKRARTNSKSSGIDLMLRPPNIGDSVAAEAVMVRSYLDIMWQDGELDLGVPATELAYGSGDLDDHLFVPGNYVLMRDEDSGKTQPGYGVVEKVDCANRVATVALYEHDFQSDTASKFIRNEQVSVYELIAHPDYDYPPGLLVMRIATDDENPAPVGQVLYTRVDGKLIVKWMNGQIGDVYPEQVCRVIGEYHIEDGGLESETEDDDEFTSDEESDADSWTTVSMDSNDEGEDGCEKELLATAAIPMASLMARPKDTAALLTKLLLALDALRENLLALRKTDADTRISHNLASALLGLYSTLKRITQQWFDLDLKTHRYGSDLVACARLLRIWVKAVEENENTKATDRSNNIIHPAKEIVSPQDQKDIESELDSELTLLNQVEQELRKFSCEGGAEAQAAAASNPDGGLVSFVRKTLRTFVRPSGWTSSRWKTTVAGSSELLPEDEENALAAQRLLQRGLVDHRNGATGNHVLDSDSDGLRDTYSFRTLVAESAKCFGQDPKHKRALAVVELSSAAVLMISRAVIEQLMRMARSEGTATEWPNDAGGNHVDAKEENAPDVKIDQEQKEVVEPEENDGRKETPTGIDECFELLERAPSNHRFIAALFDASNVPQRFVKAVRQEIKLLRSSLPLGVFVKAFEDRMDLYSCMLVGPAGTPFTDGLFFFDVNLKTTYPTEPPVFHFKSFSTEQLNPNLYLDGKVCVSLLGTWSGKDSEMWNPGSNLLQVLVSIQGLILNAEPYFNEAGFEAKRAHPESVEKSRRYNELALIRSIESLWKVAANPPAEFERDVRRHLAERGRKFIQSVEEWIDGGPCGFPLQPASQGFALSAKKQLAKFTHALTNMGF